MNVGAPGLVRATRTLAQYGRRECSVELGESLLRVAERWSVRLRATVVGAGFAVLVLVAGTFTGLGSAAATGGATSAAAPVAWSCDDLWTGSAGTTEWNSATNWSAGVPDDGSSACIPGGATVVVPDASFSVGKLTVSVGATLDVGAGSGSGGARARLSLSSGLAVNGTVTVWGTVTGENAAVLTNDGTIAVAPGGLIDLGAAATLTNEPDGLLAFGIDGAPGSTSDYGRITNGTLALDGSADPVFDDGFAPAPGEEYIVDDGTSTGAFTTVLHGATADYSHTDEVGLSGGAPATATSTSVTSTMPGGSDHGQDVRFTATVTSSPGSPPTGLVSFDTGGQLLGTSPLTSSAGVTTATLDTSDLGVGSESIVATYGGDVVFDTSTSQALTQVVDPAPTDVTITSSPASPLPGQQVTYAASVGDVTPGSGTPTGTVSFSDDGAPVSGCQYLDLPPSTPQQVGCAETYGPNTTHDIVAAYSGDLNDAGSHGSLAETVGQIPTQTSVASSSPTSTYGQGVSFTATVAPSSGSISPTGTVTFYDETTPIGSAPLSPADGVATATLASSSLMAGSHWVTATYSGDANSSTSSSVAPVRLDVAEAMTSVTLASSAAQTAVDQVVTLTATINSAATDETGTVQFDDNGSLLGVGTVSNDQATFQTSSLAPGSHPITAVYEGDDDFVGTSSTNTVNEAIVAVPGSPVPTTTSVAVSSTTPTYGESVTLTATVAPMWGTADPTGAVTFMDNGATTLGSSVLTTTDGVTTASMLLTTLPVGPNSITASYGAGAGGLGSSSEAESLTVSRSPTIIVLGSSDSPYIFGEPVTLSATVFPATGFGETGSVTFYDNGTPIGTATISNGQAELNTTFAQVGTHVITAAYGGSGLFVGSSTAAALSDVALS
jgi:Big-like domain-containing protein